MTEAKTSSSFGNLGLFATKAYTSGDVILEEIPLITLLPASDEESKSLLMEWLGDNGDINKKPAASKKSSDPKQQDEASLWNSISPPSEIDKKDIGTFRGMVQVGLCFMTKKQSATGLSDDKEKILLSLYHPTKTATSPLEQGILNIAKHAVEYLKKSSQGKNSTDAFQDWEKLEKVLLVWACNSFQGGRLYPTISRTNHDCNPNAIIQTSAESADGNQKDESQQEQQEDAQKLVAATDIVMGEEITISYLGLLLYAETPVRQEWLRKSKYFDCSCPRCSSANDGAARFPCPTCHPRELPQQSLEEDVQYDDEQAVHYTTWKTACSNCQQTPDTATRLESVATTVTKKVASLLESMETKGSNKDQEDEDEILEEHLSLASTILGDKHWTSNLLMLLHLDRRLSTMSQRMLTLQELPEMEDVAEAIDGLQRICRFMEYLRSTEVKLDMGHVMADVIIGVARTLVSLGDLKSQKYAAEWLEKIASYVDKFESEGRKKVVSALQVAYKSRENRGTGDESASKKAKTSS